MGRIPGRGGGGRGRPGGKRRGSSRRGPAVPREERPDTSGKEETIEVEGEVVETLPSATFRVQLQDDMFIEAKVSGKIRMHYVRILPGDRVKVELSPYDLTRGRIIWRFK